MTVQAPTVNELIDRAGLKPLQILVFKLCALMALVDGLDTQSIGIVAPLMARDLNLQPSALGVIFSITQLGAAVGAMTISPLGDRYGRKPMIITAGLLITLLTYLTTVATTFYPLLIVRTLAGLGLGAALPLAMALASDYAPTRLRGAVVTIVFAAYPLGGAIGGAVNGWILGHFNWHAVFYFGAALPATVAALVILLLPESIQYLILRGSTERAAGLLKRIDPRADVSTVTARPPDAPPARVPIGRLFSGGMGASTLMLWGLYLFAYATLKVMTTWFPSILGRTGFDASQGAYTLGAFNLGATIGMAAAGYLTDRFGALRALAPALVCGAVCVLLLGVIPANFSAVVALATLVGLFIGIGGSGGHAIAVRLYSPETRSTGLGLGVASSRYGQVLSPLLVAAMLTAGFGTPAIYRVVALLPLVAALFVFGLMLRARTARRAHA